MPRRDMQRFWDARAKENPFFFVDTELQYDDPDVDEFWVRGERNLNYMLELVGARVAADDVVVDLGCGLGRLTRALAKRAREVIGIDVSREMLALAAEHNPHLDNVRWVHGDGTSLKPLADASVDACVSVVVLQHIPDPAVTLGYVREMGRVLRPGGWAAFQVSTDPRVHRVRRGADALRRLTRALRGSAPRGQNDPRWRGSAVELPALERAAAEGGMAVERVVYPGQLFCVVLTRRRADATALQQPRG